MIIKKIKLENFRNIEYAELEFSKDVNVIYGENAQGKTNLLEALYFCCATKSFRVNKSRELISFDKKNACVLVEIDDGNKDISIKIEIHKSGAKIISKNGIKIERLSEVLGALKVVLFCPEHLSLIKDGPKERRNFIDMAICQIKPRFIGILNEYIKINNQRVALLRNIKEKNADKSYIDIYDEKLSSAAAKIYFERISYIDKLSRYSKMHFDSISKGRDELSLKYSSVMDTAQNEDEAVFIMKKALRDSFLTDIKYGLTTKGVHTDDLIIYVNGQNAKTTASQGQQRSAVLSMKLSEGEISKEYSGNFPVFLFDDVLSELDVGRRKYLLTNLTDKQVFITSCETAYFSKLLNKNKYFVKNGVFIKR